MNVKNEIVQWPKLYKPIPKPFAVVRCDDHFMVCKVTPEGDLIEEVSVIHWNKFIVRRWAFEFAKKEASKKSESEFVRAEDADALAERLAECEAALKFYAHPINWDCQSDAETNNAIRDCDLSIPEGLCDPRGGKRAREYFKKSKPAP